MAMFLAGVGNAEIWEGDTLIATAKTLVDSSITIGVTAEDIRAGMGAMLYGKYFHTSTFDLKLTDAMFNMQYIAMNIGADVTIGGDAVYNESKNTNTSGVITLGNTAVPMTSGGVTYCWARPSANPNSEYTRYEVNTSDNSITISGVSSVTEYCLKYIYTNIAASKVIVYGNFIPATVTIYLTANLYAGDSSNPSTGTQVGTVQIKVPRFLLNGAQELAMNMTGASQTSLEGSALGYGAEGCEGRSIYAEIIQVLANARWYSEANGLLIEDSDVSLTASEAASQLVGSAPSVYAYYPKAMPKQITNAMLSAQEANLASDKKSSLVFAIAAGTTGLTINASTGVIGGTPAAGTATVTVVAKENSVAIPNMNAAMVVVITA